MAPFFTGLAKNLGGYGFGRGGTAGPNSINTKGSGGVVELADNGMVTHVFVSPGGFDPDTTQTFVADQTITGVLFFVIGGGGGGGYAGGGGAGGAVTNAITGNTITVPAGTYPVTLGGGGHSNSSYYDAPSSTPSFPSPQPYPVAKADNGPMDGQNSVWNGYTGLGGGCGGVETGPLGYSQNPSAPHGNAGGCGGGGAQYGGFGPALGGAQVQTPQPQGPNGTNYGNNGGNGRGGNYYGGGGGGIGQVGGAAPTDPAPGDGTGGDGLMIPICPPNYGTTGPTPGRWLGGGGGSSNYPSTSYAGGAGGGNDGNIYFSNVPDSLTIPENPGTGGGGGGGANVSGRQPTRGNPGIVIIAYPNQ